MYSKYFNNGLFVCNQLYYPAPCGPKDHGSSSAAALMQRAAVF